MTLAVQPEAHPERRTITVTVDNEPVELSGVAQTPNLILAAAGIDPTSNYLVKVKGRHQESFKDLGDEQIRVHEGETFVSVSAGPTPVS